MKKYLLFFITIFTLQLHTAHCQFLRVDSTRFITGDNPYTAINYMIPTSDKGILFTGSTTKDALGIIPYIPYNYSNLLVGKIDSNHQISWIKVFGGNQFDLGISLCETSDGYAVLANTSSNDGDITSAKGASDFWLLRLDKNGTLLWQKNYGSSQSDGAVSIANTPDNGFILFGSTNGNDYDVPIHYGSSFSLDWVVIKTDSLGNVQWSKTIGGLGEEGADGSILSIDSSYYLVSWSNSHDNDCSDTMWHAGVTFPYENYYVLKLDKNGNVLWNKSYGGSSGDGAKQAIFDPKDYSIVIAGTTRSSDYMVTGYHGCDYGDMWVIKIDRNGSLKWQKAVGSIQGEDGRAICQSNKGGYLVYGRTRNSVCSDTSMGNIGFGDCLLYELDTSGNVTFQKTFGGMDTENPSTIVHYLNGYAAAGVSESNIFIEGLTNGKYASGQEAFISYLKYSDVKIEKVNNAINNEIIIFPNPAQNTISVTMPQNHTKINVVNSFGELFYSSDTKHENEMSIEIRTWAMGMYFILTRSENGLVNSCKFIKN